ncbi:nucleotidyltransferase family protein [Candidatus Peregrinibacteria bacterium]|nr:nucleotidyltransferase family protein [Candidatus Peregrinibacteria bacterium]
MTIAAIKKQALPIFKSQGVLKAAVFGSFARGDNKKNSDVDFLVKLKKNKSLFDFLELKFALEEKLNKRIDLVSYNGIHPFLKAKILEEQKIIYEKRT